MKIAIDGPACAGKTTTARALAARLGYTYVDTGAIYRAFALYLLRNHLDIDDAARIAEAKAVSVTFRNGRTELNGEDVTDYIRTAEVSKMASDASAIPAVRAYLLDTQKEIALFGDVVMEGRDIGSVIMPEAEVKFYLTADLLQRAERRYQDDISAGRKAEPVSIVQQLAQRDYNDMHRETAPLVISPGAIRIDNTNMTREQTVNAMLSMIGGFNG